MVDGGIGRRIDRKFIENRNPVKKYRPPCIGMTNVLQESLRKSRLQFLLSFAGGCIVPPFIFLQEFVEEILVLSGLLGMSESMVTKCEKSSIRRVVTKSSHRFSESLHGLLELPTAIKSKTESVFNPAQCRP